MSTFGSTQTADGSSVLVILSGMGGGYYLQGGIIISSARAWSFLCLLEVEWNKELRNTAIEPLYDMSLSAYVQPKELVVVAWIFTELRSFMKLCSGPGEGQ